MSSKEVGGAGVMGLGRRRSTGIVAGLSRHGRGSGEAEGVEFAPRSVKPEREADVVG
ncbi:hypothetical protein CROQUDRAFT_88621 [Cronartium quercuum f. sp. fusiforme G11]|uniref:Uncharacterized protein n=1 Tax=Cronartium quercuum f. sp. fusiforme G11 TaxID=708437 RepID=A0A9P6TEW0_9BASI|nr:hypothetical protein CROQUDRAFT_88621 [Cronartium quercuum f. sp. fusiforme G11]